MRTSLQLRNHSLVDIDLNRLNELHEKWLKLNDEVNEVAQQVHDLKKKARSSKVAENILLRERYNALNSVKKDLQLSRKEFFDLYLQLPNFVDVSCTHDKRIIEEIEAERQEPLTSSQPLSELVGTSTFNNVYILDRLARWEREFLDGTFVLCQRKFGFIPVLLSDFARAPIVAATCNRPSRPVIEASKEEMAKVDGDFVVNPYMVYHLVGSSSLEAFLAFLMRHGVQKKAMPVGITSLGREYVEDPNCGTVHQLNGVSFIEGYNCQHATRETFLNRSKQMWRFWKTVAPFLSLKLVSVAPESLLPFEIARHEIVMDGHQPFATVSLIGDWVSRRLAMRDFEKNHLHIVFSNFLNTDAVIKAMLSMNCDTSHCDTILKHLEKELKYK